MALALVLAAAAALVLLASLPSGFGATDETYVVPGRIALQVLQLKPASVKLFLNGGQKVTFPRPDGYFAFQGVPAGTHLIEVCAPGYHFSALRVDVSAKLHGQVRASVAETGRVLSEPLLLEPLSEELYFEKREPFSLMGLLKSPMGMMVGLMLVAVFLLPKLMDSIDPEEMKRMQEEMRNRPAPSFPSLLQGRG